MLPEATNVAGPAGGSGFLPPQAKIAVDFLLTYVRNPVFCDFGASYRPWREFLSVNKFSKPGPGEWAGRMTTNVGAFKGNYAALFVFFLIYSIVTNPMLLISIVLVGSGWAGDASLKGRPVNLFGREVTNNERKLGLVILTFLVFLLSSAGSTLFWSVGISTLVVVIHASFREPAPAEDKPKADPELGGFDQPFAVPAS